MPETRVMGLRFDKLCLPHGKSPFQLECGVPKAKIFTVEYETKLEFPGKWGGGGWCQTKKPSMGRVQIFSGTTPSSLRSDPSGSPLGNQFAAIHCVKRSTVTVKSLT